MSSESLIKLGAQNRGFVRASASTHETHPTYLFYRNKWERIRDAMGGTDAVKSQGVRYLPPTDGMRKEGFDPYSTLAVSNSSNEGAKRYLAYMQRARFPEWTQRSIERYMGILHRKPGNLSLPPRLEPMEQMASSQGESLDVVIKRINIEQLAMGRIGVLLNIPRGRLASPTPFFVTYCAESILDWHEEVGDDGRCRLVYVALDESFYEFDQSSGRRTAADQVRILRINEAGNYETFLKRDDNIIEDSIFEPVAAGRPLQELPFVMIGARDIAPDIDEPPVIEIVDLALTYYRLTADYYQALHLTGQDLLVTIGVDPGDKAIGAGAHLAIGSPDGDAKFIGIQSEGVPNQREALSDLQDQADQQATKLFETNQRQVESGTALRIRLAASTATLRTVALASKVGLIDLLRLAAEWVAANPDDVFYEPNLDFVEEVTPASDLLQLTSAKAGGAPLSLETIHRYSNERGITAMSFEEEIEKIREERELTEELFMGLDANAGVDDPAAPLEGEETGEEEEADREEVAE